MKLKLLPILAAAVLVAADEPKADAVKDELKKFAGTWKLVAANADGEEQKAEVVKTGSLVVEGDTFTLKIQNEVNKGKFVIDPSKKPKMLDLEFTEGGLKDGKVKGIYRIDGDTRKSCFAMPTADRPTDFDSGEGKFVWTWKADKTPATDKAKDKAGQPE
jgi:uncharacterized protein (TIGR03067 family)